MQRLHPPLEGEGRERSERGGVELAARKAHPTPTAFASLRRSTLPLQGRVGTCLCRCRRAPLTCAQPLSISRAPVIQDPKPQEPTST